MGWRWVLALWGGTVVVLELLNGQTPLSLNHVNGRNSRSSATPILCDTSDPSLGEFSIQRNMASVLLPAALASASAIIGVPLYQFLISSEVAGWVKIACFLVGFPIETVLFILLYRSTLHPLAKYPGPWWAGLTDLYTAYHLSKGGRHIDFYRLHMKYGKIVRFGPRRISIRSPEALRDIYSTTANVKRSQTYASTAHFFGGTPSSDTTPDMKEHAFRRRVNVRALSATNIKSMEEKILRNIQYFCDQLVDEGTQGWSSSRDMSKYIGYLVSDIMGDITFSKNWEMQQKPDNRDVLVSLPEGVAGIHLVGYLPELLSLKLDKLLFGKLIAGVNRFTSLSASIFHWRFAQQDCNDLFSALLRAKDPETDKSFSTDQLVSEAGLLTVAGSDTTITATTATFFYLAHYPDCLRRVQDEVRSQFAETEGICISPELASC
ncbi:unnamed protein product [Periconia digitata]|uniref:Cytochrome P450 n=1 Tax=Periconia digitata TaxID=1303443 RepID=A0A9W4UAR3_9PLEO|nr:unnamed protein product [Periconia digitata]